VKLLQRMLGHYSAALTLDRYGDLLPGQAEDVARRLDAMARRARPPQLAPAIALASSAGFRGIAEIRDRDGQLGMAIYQDVCCGRAGVDPVTFPLQADSEMCWTPSGNTRRHGPSGGGRGTLAGSSRDGCGTARYAALK
jgi:hypothetical protein